MLLMNQVFKSFIGHLIMVYVNDILIFNRTLEELWTMWNNSCKFFMMTNYILISKHVNYSLLNSYSSSSLLEKKKKKKFRLMIRKYKLLENGLFQNLSLRYKCFMALPLSIRGSLMNSIALLHH